MAERLDEAAADERPVRRSGTRSRGGAARSRGGVGDLVGTGLAAAAALLLAGMVAWAPLPYGSARGWSWSLLAAMTGGILVLAGASRVMGKRSPTLPWMALPAVLCTAAVWAWAWAQSLPVDGLPVLASALQPHPFWAEARSYGLDVVPVTGLGAEAARGALMKLIAYGGTFWAALVLLRRRAWARSFLVGLVIVVTIYSAYGLVNQLAGWDTVLWEGETKSYKGYVTSTFVNRNNFATYANLGLIAAIGLFVEPFLVARGAADLKRIAREALQQLLGRQGPLLVAIVIISAAMLLSGSRGGFLSIVVALIAFGLLTFGATRPRPLVILGTIAVAALVGWGVIAVSGDVVLQRLSEIEGTGEGRTLIWADTLDMIRARPTLGQGYGTYVHAFPFFQDVSAQPLLVDLAHDTYLEHAAELGVPATVLLYLGPLLLFLYCVRGVLVRRRDQVFALVAASGTVLVAVHSLVDFSLQIPAIAVTYAVVLGIGVAQSVPSPRPQHGASLRD